MSDAVDATFRAFFERGWVVFPWDAAMAAWAEAASRRADALMAAPDAEYRCGGTWFPGVNILPNAPDGAIDGVSLAGPAIDYIARVLGFADIPWDRAQISACSPGYPKHGAEETEAAHRFRVNRAAAHVDGLLREPPARRRRLGEAHGFILGVPLSAETAGASPLVVWEGSHERMRAAFAERFSGVAPDAWGREDVTEAYQAARAACFDACPRVEISAAPGQAYLVHRLALHGVAPWRAAADAPPRVVAYLRPDPYPGATPAWWLSRP